MSSLEDPYRDLLEKTRGGSAAALEQLLREIQTPLYNFLLRMLWQPEDAADATQDVLVKICTNLGGFRGESRFLTWAYRIAAHHVFRLRRSRREVQAPDFDGFAAGLARGMLIDSKPAVAGADQALLEQEVKLGCMTGLLLCLDREHRAAYILGEIFEVSGSEAAAILDLPPTAYRKRLSRARERLRGFLQQHCGLTNPAAPCHCKKQANAALQSGLISAKRTLFAGHPQQPATLSPQRLSDGVGEMDELERIAALYRTHPHYRAPERFTGALRALLASGSVSILE
ncbi:MAG: RNA polymerase sigma factor [Leptospirales bacterium]|nr:RNA polymerase sigma factor [Leptospirales bacterium]